MRVCMGDSHLVVNSYIAKLIQSAIYSFQNFQINIYLHYHIMITQINTIQLVGFYHKH